MEALFLVAVAVLLAGLSIGLGRRYHQLRQTASGWLAVTFGSLALAAVVSALQSLRIREGSESDALWLLLALGVASYVYGLFRFSDAMEPASAWMRTAMNVFLVAEVASGGLALALPSVDVVLWAFFGLAAVLVLLWVGVHVRTARAVWRTGGRLSATIARVRARTMVVGVVGMGLALIVGVLPISGWDLDESATGATSTAPDDTVQSTLALLLGGVAAAVLAIGFTPPRWLRWVWTRSDVERLVAAELALQRQPTTEVLEREVLPDICAVLSGRAAWLSIDGQVRGAYGVDPAAAAETGFRPTGGHTMIRRPTSDSPDDGWYVVVNADRGQLVVRTTEEPVLYGIGDVDGIELITARLVNMLQRAELEERERHSRHRLDEARHLEQVATLKDDVLSTLSHELRTPLVTVCGVSELLLSRWTGTTDEQRLRMLQRVYENATDLRSLVEDTLDLASLRSGQMSVQRAPLALRRLVDHVLEDPRLAMEHHRITLEVPDDLEIVVDAVALSRVLRHLVRNALKFSDDDTSVTVRAQAGDDAVTIDVIDQGVGLTADERQQIFEPFYRTGDVLTRETRGLGVGLALAAESVRGLGGTIEVDSAPGEGSRFTVVLPLAASPAHVVA